MNEVTDLIVGIDLGSSGLVGGIARRDASGKTTLLALKQVSGYVGIRRGAVHNIEVAGAQVQSLIKNLLAELNLDAKVVKVHIGVNGFTVHTIDAKASLPLSGDERLTDEHLDELNDEAQNTITDEFCIIDHFPQEFLVDSKVDTNPVGTMPRQVEAHYKIVVGKPFLYKNLDVCFESLDLGYKPILGSLASAEAVLTPEEKAKGVVVADFGAETTSLIVFKNNIVRYAVVLPFGGGNITKDLQHINLDILEAERVKLETGTALHYDETGEGEDAGAEKYSTFEKDVNEIIVSRIEEIVENVWAQIRYSGIEPQKLTEGIVLTGGASKLDGLSTLLTKKTGLTVRMGNPYASVVLSNGVNPNIHAAQCIGLLLLGEKACLQPAIKVTAVKEVTSVAEPVFDGFEPNITPQQKRIRRDYPPSPPIPHPPVEKVKNPMIGKLIQKMKGIFDDEDT